jgi:hypothetical protein
VKRLFREDVLDLFVTMEWRRIMSRLFSVCRYVQSHTGSATNRANLRRALGLVAIGGVFALTQALAKEPAEGDAKLTSKIKSAGATAPAAETAIPDCLEKLKLTQPQQTQAKEIVRKYDADLDAVWKQFGEKYMETVRTEVSLLAAIEDNLTEAQRTKVRDQRRKMARAEKATEGTAVKPNRATEKNADPVNDEIAFIGVSLTPEQESAADKIHEKYLGHLRSLNRDIQGLHTRLVSLEADKLVEIEKLLTKEQLAQMREARQTLPAGAKVTANDRFPAKTE